MLNIYINTEIKNVRGMLEGIEGCWIKKDVG